MWNLLTGKLNPTHPPKPTIVPPDVPITGQDFLPDTHGVGLCDIGVVVSCAGDPALLLLISCYSQGTWLMHIQGKQC